MHKLIGVVSGKGGVGKTTIAINLALASHVLGRSSVVVDADMSASNLGLHLGFYQFPAGIQDALKKNLDALDVIYTHTSGLNFIPASISLRYIGELNSHRKLRSLLEDINSLAFIDSPPGFEKSTANVMRACDEVVAVTNPELPAVVDAIKAIRLARELGKPVLGVIVNRSTGRYEMSPQEIAALCETQLLGVVPDDRHMKKSLYHRTPLVAYRPHAKAAIAIKGIAASISGIPYRPPALAALRRLLDH